MLNNIQIIRTADGAKKFKQVLGHLMLSEYEIKYLVLCQNSHNNVFEIAEEVFNSAPESHNGLFRDSIDLGDYDDSGNLEITVKYSDNAWSSTSSDDEDEEEPTFNFDCSTGTAHITHAIKERIIKGKAAGKTIGWNGQYGDDMEIAGVDIPIAQMTESYTKIIRLSKLTNSYRRKIAMLTGKVNSKAFKGWEAGEVMFMGCSFSTPDKSSAKVTVTFNFTIQPNEKNASVAGVTFSKRGFEYAWAISKTVAVDGKTPKIETEGVYVNQIVQYADFGVLEL